MKRRDKSAADIATLARDLYPDKVKPYSVTLDQECDEPWSHTKDRPHTISLEFKQGLSRRESVQSLHRQAYHAIRSIDHEVVEEQHALNSNPASYDKFVETARGPTISKRLVDELNVHNPIAIGSLYETGTDSDLFLEQVNSTFSAAVMRAESLSRVLKNMKQRKSRLPGKRRTIPLETILRRLELSLSSMWCPNPTVKIQAACQWMMFPPYCPARGSSHFNDQCYG